MFKCRKNKLKKTKGACSSPISMDTTNSQHSKGNLNYFIFISSRDFRIGNCNNFVKQKILVINEMKQDKISFKPKV
jgi:hypothetical protein